jgi:DNA polymerase-3 subunit alpha
MSFNHALATRSDFSIGESMLSPSNIVDIGKGIGYETVTLMDTMSIHGMVDFSNKAVKSGIKPIIGCRIAVVYDPTYRLPTKASGIAAVPNPESFIKVYVKDEIGIKSLMKLLSKANSKEYFYYHARVGWKDVFELKGVAISTGDFNSIWHRGDGESILKSLMTNVGEENVFVELSPINTPLFDTLNAKALMAAKNLCAKTLVTYPVMYRDDADADSLDVLSAIASGTKMNVSYRPSQFVKEFGFHGPKKTLERMGEAAKRIGKFNSLVEPDLWRDGAKNMQVLADMCSYTFKKAPVSLPEMAENEFEALGKKCIEGWRKRFSKPVLGHMPAVEDYPKYQERLRFEMSVLKKMGFAGYFLLVEDLVMWAKKNEIIVGPGRGSVGGSLVAYLIGITDVDPIRFNLLFERFINPERMDLPDADLDFMSSKRHLVIDYLAKRYGSDRVAGISNYSTLASASALRDTGRMFDLSGLDMMATKLVPKEHGQSVTLTEAAAAVPDLEKFKDSHPQVWRHAIKLEGAMRSFGRHAAGVVVAGEPLINRAVIETRDADAEVPVVCWDKRVVEDWGLVKMDILGLSTLDILELARQNIKERHGKTINYIDLPLEEKDVMNSFARGDTTGVFQFESSGMAKLLRDIGSGGNLTFEDITAATALYRPGPMDSGLMSDFVMIKQGHKEPYYEHPNMIPALKDTYGVMIYQEQIMRVAVDLCGFSLTQADHLRKAIGKKDAKMMGEAKDSFVTGAGAGNIEVELDDGRVVIVHRLKKFAVKESADRFTLEEILEKDLTLLHSL